MLRFKNLSLPYPSPQFLLSGCPRDKGRLNSSFPHSILPLYSSFLSSFPPFFLPLLTSLLSSLFFFLLPLGPLFQLTLISMSRPEQLIMSSFCRSHLQVSNLEKSDSGDKTYPGGQSAMLTLNSTLRPFRVYKEGNKDNSV